MSLTSRAICANLSYTKVNELYKIDKMKDCLQKTDKCGLDGRK